MDKNQVNGERLLINYIYNLHRNHVLDMADIDGFRAILAAKNKRYGIIVDMAQKNIFFGTDGNDNLRGTNSGDMFWLEKGNNTITGGVGDNIYFMGNNFGTNTIHDAGGTNTIFFLSDMPFADVQVMPNTYDVVISALNGTGRTILKNYKQNAIYDIVFADGFTWTMNLLELVGGDDYISIRTAKDLNDIKTNLSGKYRLMADIDLSGVSWEPIGTNTVPFEGVIDGNGYVIKNMSVNRSTQDYIGLIGRNNGTIKNLGLENGKVTGRNNTGSLTGHNAGIIENCFVSGISIVHGGANTGGLVGRNTGNIKGSFSTAHTAGSSYTGGLAGLVTNSGTITQCYATGNVYSGYSIVGGFAGYIEGATSSIRNCFSVGKVVGSGTTAGFIGNIASGIVENSYSLSDNVNGFNSNGTMYNCYYDSSLINIPTTRPGARETSQMMRKSNYTDWDFDTIWEIEEGLSYPTLKGVQKPKWRVEQVIEIHTLEDILDISNDLMGDYRLMADIDLAGVDWTPIGNNTTPLVGKIDGNGYVIKNMSINRPNLDYVGLIGRNMGTVVNVGLENAKVTGKNYVGSLMGYNTGVVENCFVSGISSVHGERYIGGLIGYTIGNIKGSFSNAHIIGSSEVGGFVGYVSYGVGGVTIEQCYATGNVSSNGAYIGGFAGYLVGASSTIRNCISVGKVAGGNSTAGFIGYIQSGRIENSYSLSNNINGFNSNGTVYNCYYDSNLIKIPTIGPSARETAQMMSQSNYIGWDFDSIWDIEEGVGYPTLKGVQIPKWRVEPLVIEIRTAEELQAISNDLLGDYRLMTDIDIEGTEWLPVGTIKDPFNGVLDGNGFNIKNLTINHSEQDYVGLIGYNWGTLTNLTIKKAAVTGRSNVGSLAGYSTGTITDCTVNEIKVTGTDEYLNGYTGGFVGRIGSGNIKNSAAVEVFVTSNGGNVGDFVGCNTGNISMSYATGNVYSGNSSVGGFVGESRGGIIEQCYAATHVNGSSSTGGFAGSVFGSNAIIRNSYSTGYIIDTGSDSASFVGGIISGRVENCYTTSNSDNGFSQSTRAINSYFDKDRLGIVTTKAEARTTSQMMSKNNYIGWDFDTIWEIEEGSSYPKLKNIKNIDVETVIEIHTAEELNAIRNKMGKSYRLMADIDLKDIIWIPIGTNTNPFYGVLDGNGFTVNNLTINQSGQNYIGLIGYNHGILKNLTIEGVDVTGRNYVGSLAGFTSVLLRTVR